MKKSRIAQRKVRKTSKKTINPKVARLFFYVVGFLVLMVVIVFGILKTQERRIVLAVPRANGDILVGLFDPKQSNITSVLIPADSLVSVSSNLGDWRLRSVWKLGQDEGVGGRLLTQTLAKSFRLPVESWADTMANGFFKGGMQNVYGAMFSGYTSNLSLVDKLNLGILSLRVPHKEVDYDLTRNLSLEKNVLPDGDSGYVLRNKLDERIGSLFVNPELIGVSVIIVDKSGDQVDVSDLGLLMEAMGAKVVATTVGEIEQSSCLFSGQNQKVLDEFKKIIKCNTKIDESGLQTEVKLYLGAKFSL